MLLEHPGQIVTREELRRRLWTEEFVDFEQGLARAVNKLREALGDSAENPRFIETLPRRGFRFIAPVHDADLDGDDTRRGARSLAILPLHNAASAAGIDYLCDGITETLIFSAAQLAGLRVMARATVFRYKGTEVDPQTVGRELHVDTILTGRVRQRGDNLVLQVELVDVGDGALLWGEQYTRRFADILPVQEEISAEIFSKLRLKLSRGEVDRASRRQTSDPEAYSHYLQGRYYWNKRSADGFKKAITHFQQAVELDPLYALGHSGIADYYTILSIFPYSFVPPAEAMPRAKQAALRALEIDPQLAEAYATLGMINFCYEWSYPEAEKHFRIALDLKPGYATAHQWYSFLLAATSRFEEAVNEARKSLEIDPRSGIASSLAAVPLYFSRQIDRATEELRKSVLIEPTSFIPHLFLGYTLSAAGDYRAAIESFSTACRLSGDNLTALTRLGYAYGCAGKSEEAQAVLFRLDEEKKRRFVPAHHFAFLYLGLGDKDRTFAALERAQQEHSDYLCYAALDPPFDALHQDSRFADLLSKMNVRSHAVTAH